MAAMAAMPPQPAGQTPTSQVRVLFTSKNVKRHCVWDGILVRARGPGLLTGSTSLMHDHACRPFRGSATCLTPPRQRLRLCEGRRVKGRLWAVLLSPPVRCGKHRQLWLHESFSHGCTTMEMSISNRFEVRPVEESEAWLFWDRKMWIIQRLSELIGLQMHSTNSNLWFVDSENDSIRFQIFWFSSSSSWSSVARRPFLQQLSGIGASALVVASPRERRQLASDR